MRTTTAKAPARPVAVEDDGEDEEAHPAMRTGKTLRPIKEPKKKGVPVLTWLILGVLAIVGCWFLLQNRVQTALQQASEPTPAAPAEPVAGSAPAPQSNFNPRSLDVAHSGHLRLGLDSFPSAVVLAVQVDGGQYWSGQAGPSNGGDLVIPAGRHEVRVAVYGAGGAGATFSNSASGDFSSRKRLLLNAQVRPEPAPGSATLSPGSRITLTIRPDSM